MGGGSWTAKAYATYACSTGRGYDPSTATLDVNYTSASQAFIANEVDSKMDPKNVIRECCDSDEHPNTIPIILALDVTGSMGNTAIKIQKKLNPIMEDIYKNIKDAEIMIMAIGDLAYDNSPIQLSQFESDIRIAENLDKIYFESGGGGNGYESYTAAWYMGLKHCKLDCWKRGKKGLIITMGDESINPYLPCDELRAVTGDEISEDINTKGLYSETIKKYDVYHIAVESSCYPNQQIEAKTFAEVIGNEHVMISSVDDIHKKIVNIVKDFANKNKQMIIVEDSSCGNSTINEISW